VPQLDALAEELCEKLARFEPGVYSVAQCGEVALLLARTAKACEVAAARAAARAHGDDAGDRLAAASGSSVSSARAALAVVENASARPEVEDALRAGAVSIAQASAIASAPAEHEAELLALARGSGLRSVRDEARRHRLAAIDVEVLHVRQQAAREVVHGIDDDLGMIRLDALLPPEVGVPLVNRLDVETDRTWRAAQRRGEDITRAQAAADAFVRMTRGDGKAKARSPELILVGDLVAFQRGHAHPGEVSHILGGGHVPVSTLRAHARDAFIKIVLHGGVKIDTVLHWGRYRRAELETALMLGTPPAFDGVTCDEDGCDRRYGLQWDHVDPVSNGGVTSLDNLRPLCRPHHVEKTERDREQGKLGNRKERGP
jgi:hypothetical protein